MEGTTNAKAQRFGDHKKFEKPKIEQKGGNREAGRWGKPLKDEVSQRSKDWMTEALDIRPRSVPCLEGDWESQYKVLTKV